jgi:hypothetical protein
MRSGEQLSLVAMKKEFARLSKIADKKKAICDDACSCGSKLIDLYKKANELIKSKDFTPEGIKKVQALADEEKRLHKIMKSDLVKIMDEQINAEIERDNLGREISMIEWRIKRHG